MQQTVLRAGFEPATYGYCEHEDLVRVFSYFILLKTGLNTFVLAQQQQDNDTVFSQFRTIHRNLDILK